MGQDYSDTGKLIIAITTLEGYPQFESMIPKLKKELKLRFENAHQAKRKGYKRLYVDWGHVRYYPNGLVSFKHYYVHQPYKTFLEPFEFGRPAGKKKKVSPTRQLYVKKFRHIIQPYKDYAYLKVGINVKHKKKVFDEDLYLDFYNKAKNILQQKLSNNIKRDLLEALYTKFNDMPGRNWNARLFLPQAPWKDGGYDKNAPIKDDVDYAFSNAMAALFKLHLTEKNYEHSGYHNSVDSKYRETMKTKYEIPVILPTEEFISYIMNPLQYKNDDYYYHRRDGDFEDNFPVAHYDGKQEIDFVEPHQRYDNKRGYIRERVPHIHQVIRFNSFPELIEKYKKEITSLNIPEFTQIVKNLGFKITEEKETKRDKTSVKDANPVSEDKTSSVPSSSGKVIDVKPVEVSG